jgi:hypothetical protein
LQAESPRVIFYCRQTLAVPLLRGALKKSISGLLFAGKKYPAVIHANEDGGDNSKARLIYWPLVTVALMAITALH